MIELANTREQVYEIARKLDSTRKFVESVGVEMEGGLCREKFDKIIEKYGSTRRLGIGSDASVRVYESDTVCEKWWVFDAEIKYWSRSVVDVIEFADYVFSLGFKQNSTCGNHHHFKFVLHPLVTTVLMSLEAIKMYKKLYLKVFGNNAKYVDRLKNKYCYMQESVYDIILNFTDTRYYAFNVLSYFESQNTLEIRIMPHAEDFVEYANQILFNVQALETIISKLMKNNEFTLKVPATRIIRALESLDKYIEKKREREIVHIEVIE